MQDGWILAKFFFFFAFLWTETKYRSIKTQKQKRGQYPATLTILVNKGFILWPKDYTKEFRFCGNKAENPEQAGQVYLARSGSQSEYKIRFIFPACEASHIVKTNNTGVLHYVL